jgi:hypothetical protein
MTTKKTETPKTVIVKKKRAVGKSTTPTEEVVEVEAVTVPTEEEVQESAMIQAERDFMQSMKVDNLPPQAKYMDIYIFHRETGRELKGFREIFKSGRNGFEVWSKTYESALEIFMDKSRWEERMGDTPCPMPEESKYISGVDPYEKD